MLGELNNMQIDNLLLSQAIGRIGYSNGKRIFITPVTYAFDGKNIIGQSQEGAKLQVMRTNPSVCFQVDMILNMANWQSVLIHGIYRELKGKEAEEAREILFNRVMPLTTSATIHGHEHRTTAVIDDSNRIKPVMYKIKIKEKSGRFEKQ